MTSTPPASIAHDYFHATPSSKIRDSLCNSNINPTKIHSLLCLFLQIARIKAIVHIGDIGIPPNPPRQTSKTFQTGTPRGHFSLHTTITRNRAAMPSSDIAHEFDSIEDTIQAFSMLPPRSPNPQFSSPQPTDSRRRKR